MKKFLTTLFIAVCCTGLVAQNFWPDYPRANSLKKDGSNARSSVWAEGMFAYGCDGVNNEFMTKLYMGGFMDSSFIEQSAMPLLPVNRFGVHTIAGIRYSSRTKDTTGEMWSLSVQQRNNITGRFSDDAFRLAFQGNTRFKGEEADFSRTRFTSMSWSQVKFGYLTPLPHGYVSFSFSLLAGHRYNQADIEYAKLYTDSQGLNVAASVAGDYWSSDTANTSQFALNGFGTSVDIVWHWWNWLPGNNWHGVKLDLLDFGFINWNNKTLHQYVDTTFQWSGVDVTPLFLDPDYVAELPSDSIFIKSDTTEFHRSLFLPAVARFTYIRSFFGSRLTMKASAAAALWSEALPYGSLTAGWNFEKAKVTLAGGVAYGGYARLQVPLKVEVYSVRQTCLEIGTINALSFIDPSGIAGGGAYVKLNFCF
jgi:hypothetical protein